MADLGTTMTDLERGAIVAEASQRLAELRRVAADLWPDRDDPLVTSELVAVFRQMRETEAELQ